jgi:hypothetical protein
LPPQCGIGQGPALEDHWLADIRLLVAMRRCNMGYAGSVREQWKMVETASRPCPRKATKRAIAQKQNGKRKKRKPQEPGYPGSINGDNAAYSSTLFCCSPTFQFPSSILANRTWAPRRRLCILPSSTGGSYSRSPSSPGPQPVRKPPHATPNTHKQKHVANPFHVSVCLARSLSPQYDVRSGI